MIQSANVFWENGAKCGECSLKTMTTERTKIGRPQARRYGWPVEKRPVIEHRPTIDITNLESQRSFRNRQIDLLRGVAVLLVIAHHYPYFGIDARFGWTGVDLFFVLSGFLISGLLFKEWQQTGSLSVRRFLVRRAFKIYPAFYVFLCITALGLIASQGVRAFASNWLGAFTVEVLFFQDYLAHFWGHTWSLGVEEHFYFALPFLLILLRRHDGFDLIPRLSIGVAGLCLALRFMAATSGATIQQVKFPAHLRADALFAGVALAYLFHFKRERFMNASKWWLPSLAILLLLPAALLGQDKILILPFVLSCNCIGYSLIVLWIVPRSYLRCQLLEQIGIYSYSIYIWHALIIRFWEQYHRITLLTFMSNLACCVVAGIVAAQLVELPVLALREKLFPRTTSKRVTDAALPDLCPQVGGIPGVEVA